MQQNKYSDLANKTVFFGGIFLLAALAGKFLWAAVLPFFVAWVVSLPIRAFALRLSKKTKLNFKFCGVICLVLILATLFFLLKIGLSLLCGEILSLYDRLIRDPRMILEFVESASERLRSAGGVFSIFDKLSESEELSGIAESLKIAFSDAISSAVSSVGQKISGAAVNTASKIPSALLLFIVFFSSCFYFTCDDGKISGFFVNLFPDNLKGSMSRLKSSIKEIVLGYISASLLLCLITFLVVLVGLLCIGCRYAILMSLVVALVDMLPILGSGVILVPWSIFCFLWSDIKTGIALLIIWVITAVVRQIAEPKLIGKRIGLHPLASVAAVYIGAKTFGFIGIVAGPLVAVGIKALLPIFKSEKPK